MLSWLRVLAGALLVLPVLGVAAPGANAQDAAPAPQAGATGAVPPENQLDVSDILRRLFKDPPPADPAGQKPGDDRALALAIVPIIGYNPSAGFVVGVAGSLSRLFGDPATTGVSSALVGLSYSTRQQASLTARFGVSGRDNQWRLDGDNRVQWTSQDSYGLGMDTGPGDRVKTKFTYVRVYDVAWYELAEHLYAGGGFHYSLHADVRPGVEGDPAWEDSAYVAYSRENGFDAAGQSSAGVSVNVMLDTRDNPVNASRGWLAAFTYRPFFRGFLGGDAAWQEAFVDVRSFFGVTRDRRHRIGTWVHADIARSGTAPYFDLPSLGAGISGRSGRGYTEGRFRGERLAYGEVEYRATLMRNGLLGLVAFANTTTVADEKAGQKLFDRFAAAGGIGLRLLFSKRSGTNLCIDYAWGRQGARGFYLAFQDAF